MTSLTDIMRRTVRRTAHLGLWFEDRLTGSPSWIFVLVVGVVIVAVAWLLL